MKEIKAVRKIVTMGSRKLVIIPKRMLPLDGEYVKIVSRDGKIVITNIQKESA